MRWMMEAGYACATSWSGANAIAVYSGGVQFIRPIDIGQVAEVTARLLVTTERSMHLGIWVRAADATSPDALTLCTQALTVFVHVGPEGTATPVREHRPSSGPEVQLVEHAASLVTMRKAMPPLEL